MKYDPSSNLGDRAQGWLRFLWRKATTADDWSPDGEPHEWWDRYSTPPMTSFPRFDLSESSYALAMMADVTPAWREVYTRILDELVSRHTTFWAAVDWLTQFGPDPKRGEYPEKYRALIPEHLWGRYDVPGWTANGVEPWGLQKDPIGSDGNLFFRGFFNLVLSTQRYVSGSDKWEEPFAVAGVERSSHEWSHTAIVEFLAKQWAETPAGPHCENTKIWPYCLSAAGLGLQLYDKVKGSEHHWVFERWVEYCKKHYMSLTPDGRLQSMALYYDPIESHGHQGGPTGGLAPAFYITPQDPAFGELLYDSGVEALGWRNSDTKIEFGDPRIAAILLNLAREFGDDVIETRLREAADTTFDPRQFGDTDEFFGYWFGLDENWPRGQLSSLAICADVGERGGWSRVFREPVLDKFDLPTVTGVDFPDLGIDRARNDTEAGILQVATVAGSSSLSGEMTSFRVENLPDIGAVRVRCDGEMFERWRTVGLGKIEIPTTIGSHSFEITWRNGAGDRASRPAAGASASGSLKDSSPIVQGTQQAAAVKSAARTGCDRWFDLPLLHMSSGQTTDR